MKSSNILYIDVKYDYSYFEYSLLYNVIIQQSSPRVVVITHNETCLVWECVLLNATLIDSGPAGSRHAPADPTTKCLISFDRL